MNLPPFPEGYLPASPREKLLLVQWGEQCRATGAEAERGWKDAVLDHLAICCMDAPQDEPPYKIVGRIIDWHVMVAIDPAVNGGFKLVPVDAAMSAEKKTALDLSAESEGPGCPA